MIRVVIPMAVVLLAIPTLRARGADEMLLPVRNVTSEAERVPKGAAPIGVTTELFEISLTKLEQTTGIQLAEGPNGELTLEDMQAIVDALSRSEKDPSPSAAARPVDAQAFLDVVKNHNIARPLTSVGQTTATGPANRLVAGGLETMADVGTKTRTKSGSKMSFYAVERDEGTIALDLRVQFVMQTEVRDSDDIWQQAAPIEQQDWQVDTVQPAGQPTIWIGPVEERTEAIEKQTWYGRRKIVERENRIARLLVVTPEIK